VEVIKGFMFVKTILRIAGRTAMVVMPLGYSQFYFPSFLIDYWYLSDNILYRKMF
jgi:hypothetical protein